MADSTESLIAVGAVTRPHGVRGAVYVTADTDNPDRFVRAARFRTSNPRFPMLVVRQIRQGPHGLIVEFAGVTDVERAAQLVGTELMISPEQRRPLDDDEFWPDQLVGLDVIIGTERIGTIQDVLLGPQDRIVVARNDGSIGEIPLVKELVPEVAVEGGWVRIDPPEGIFSRH